MRLVKSWEQSNEDAPNITQLLGPKRHLPRKPKWRTIRELSDSLGDDKWPVENHATGWTICVWNLGLHNPASLKTCLEDWINNGPSSKDWGSSRRGKLENKRRSDDCVPWCYRKAPLKRLKVVAASSMSWGKIWQEAPLRICMYMHCLGMYVCVCMYACMHACMSECIWTCWYFFHFHIHTYACLFIWTNESMNERKKEWTNEWMCEHIFVFYIFIFICLPACLPPCLNPCRLIWMNEWMNECMYVCMYERTYIYMCVCKPIYLCIYLFSYLYIYWFID